jgi:hypothetical protein
MQYDKPTSFFRTKLTNLIETSSLATTQRRKIKYLIMRKLWAVYSPAVDPDSGILQLLPRVNTAQGWARDLKFRDRDDTETFGHRLLRSRRDRETFAVLSETRPRRDAIVFETSARP